jgi:nicotinate-nucleotide adenylyltransferase
VGNIGVFGGAFDPVHKGHLALVRTAVEQCDLVEVIFIPTAHAPHKVSHASFPHRLAMLEQALSAEDGWSISCIEAKRQGPSYTVDTLELLIQTLIKEQTPYLLLGADSLLDLPHWRSFTDILQQAHLIVAGRPGIAHIRVEEGIKALPGGYSEQGEAGYWQRADGKTIRYLHQVQVDISSSELRNRLANHQPCPEALPKVMDYIRKHRLYGIR